MKLKATVIILSLVAWTTKVEALPPDLSANKTKLAVSSPLEDSFAVESSAKTSKILSNDAKVLAEQIGIMPLLEEYVKIPSKTASTQAQINNLSLRQDLLETLLATSLDVRSTCNRIDRELADTNQVLAFQAERRDRAVRLNTYANFLSGGVSGIVRGSMKLGNINDIPPEIIETTEGSIQTSLATWALRQQQGDRRLEKQLPNTLAKIMVTSESRPAEMPEVIWTYLNTVPDKGKVTRRTNLLERWSKLDMCLIHAGHREPPKVTAMRIAGTHKVQTINIAVLQDRVAMLTELRVMILEMDDLLLQLMEVIKKQRQLN